MCIIYYIVLLIIAVVGLVIGSMDTMFELKAPFKASGDQPAAIKSIIAGLDEGLVYQTVLGVTGSGKTFTMAQVIANTGRPSIVLAPNKTLAAQLYSELRDFFPNNAVEYFVSYYDYYQPEAYVAATDTFIEKDASINEQIEQMRLSATKSLIERQDVIIVATVSAIYGLGDPKSYLKMVLHISSGEQVERVDFLRRLAELQYKRNDLEFKRCCYRVRGDVVDVFPADSDKEALRIEFFDNEVERISTFDPLTNSVLSSLPRVTIFPKTHYVTPKNTMRGMIDKINSELKQRLDYFYKENLLVEAQRLEQRVRFDIEMILELGYCSGIENYSRYLSGRGEGEPPPTLMDYLPENALVFIDESHVTIPQIGAMYHGDRSRKDNLVRYGFRLPSAMDNRPLKFEEFTNQLTQAVFVSATPGPFEQENAAQTVELVVRPTGLIDPEIEILPVATQVDDLLSQIGERTKKGDRVLVTTLTKRMSEDLTDYLSDHGVKVRYLHSDVGTVERVEILRDLRLGRFDVLVGINLLREGLDLPEVSLVAILDADKEGFLRSERALIQTIGRAARNLHGKAILYADRITPSMDKAIKETNRRRLKQEQYNKQHGITPRGIEKKINDILDVEHRPASPESIIQQAKLDEEAASYQAMSPKKLSAYLSKLEREMLEFAADLEFEQAAKMRNKIQHIKKLVSRG